MTLIDDAQQVSVGNTITVIIGRLSFPKSAGPGVQIIVVYLARGYRDCRGDVRNLVTGNCHGGPGLASESRSAISGRLFDVNKPHLIANRKILFGVYIVGGRCNSVWEMVIFISTHSQLYILHTCSNPSPCRR